MIADLDDQACSLSMRERDLFREQGFLGPYTLFTPEEMDEIRPGIERILETDAPDHAVRCHNRHLDEKLIHDISTHPAILDRMTALYGNDLLIWRTNFFIKEKGAKEIPWHQDFNYWPLEPPIIVSCWIAIDQATQENGCVQMIPGSHRKVVPHVRATKEMQFGEMADSNYYDESDAINLEMRPGEFIIFNERTLHHSEPNYPDKGRIGLAVRVIPPIVKVLSWDSPNHKLVLIRGEDSLGQNELVEPPVV
jgi:ectoine hydroxylase-related dioxygenase (phytanoyl-CoA dioxygenase family)